MYIANKKIETFHSAYKGGYEPSRVLFIFCLLCAINAALPSAGLAAINVEPGTTVQVGEEVYFDGGSVTISGAALLPNGMIKGSYEWDFGDGYGISSERSYPFASGGTSASHFFANPGTYTVTLTVTDINGLNKVETATITVTGQAQKLPPRPSVESILELKFDGNLDVITSGSGLTAQWQGTGSFVNGIEGRAADLTTGSYIEVLDPNGTLDGMTELTISIWARKKNPDVSGYLLDKNGPYSMRLDFGSGKASVRGDITTQSSTAAVSKWPAYEIVDERWHHYVITYNGSLVKLFIDGIENIYPKHAPKDLTGAVQASANNLLIGKKFGAPEIFDGYIDEVKIYDKALTPEEAHIGFELWHANFHGRTAQYIYAQIPGEFTKEPANKIKATITGDTGFSKNLLDKSNLQSEEKFLLNNAELPAGNYTLTVQILNSGNSLLDELTEKFEKPYDGILKVGINENNAIVVNGELFFPVTPWILGAGGISTWSSYINVLFGQSWDYKFEDWPNYLDSANANNLQVIGPAVFEQGSSLHRNANMSSLIEYVDTTKNHNALFMWAWKDEPVSVKGVSSTAVRSWTYKTQALDPNHLVATTYELGSWIRGPLTNVDIDIHTRKRKTINYRDNAFWFGKRTNIVDVVGVDWYPIAYQNLRTSDPPFTQPFERVDGYVVGLNRFIDENYNLVPVMTWVEATGSIPATPEQLKMLIWLNIVHGAKGINWFHYGGSMSPENFAVMAEFLAQITQLTSVVLGPETERVVTDNANVGGNRVDTMIREHGGNIYIFAVRLTEVPEADAPPISVTFNVEGITDAATTVFDEARTIEVESGAFQDTFAPNAVHIYKIPLSAETHTLSVNAENGSVTKSPDKASYNHGETVSLQASADTGYNFVNWTGDVTGSSNPATVVMDADKSVTANFAINTYTLSMTAENGSVTKSPDKASYNHGETVSLQASADTGYNFVNWTGDVTGSSNPATVVMDADKSVTANFAINTYTLNITALNGSVTKTPDKASYNYGEEVILQATADTGYSFVNWSVDVSGSSNPATIVIDADKSVTANFAINTYTLNITALNGSVTKTPDNASYNHGEEVTLQAVPDTGYSFVNWSGDLTGSSNSVTIVMNADKSVTANFAIDEVDLTAPTVTNLSPQADSIQAPLNTLVILDITDSGDGVDANSVTINVNDNIVYSGNTATHSSTHGKCHRIGTKAHYAFIYQSNEMFDFDQPINVTAKATDLAGNVMDEYSYSFKTEMRSFGKNKSVDPRDVKKGRPVTVCDNSGNIWAAWHAGVTGSRDIYIGKLEDGAVNFDSSVQLTSDAAECNPVTATGSDGKLYVAWQDNRRGNWDIYISTSNDWSAEIRVTDSNDNQINPAIVVDSSLPNNVYIVWEDDRNGNQDIYVAKSSNGFATKTVTQITSDASDQVEPAIAADSDNTIYVVWTDTRNGGKKDIYGAASNNGLWTNIPVVAEEESQSSPAIATEAVGAILHLVWVDDRTTDGDDDIFYAKTTGGLTPLTGSSIIDDDTGADQISPVIITTGTGNDLKVFACWRDERNADADLYAVEIGAGAGTNVFVGDDGTNSDQSEPAIGIDGDGHPYLVWTNERTDIYYAGSTFIEPVVLASSTVSVSSKTTVGTVPGSITNIDDVSAEVPQGAYLCDVKVTISRIRNPHKPPSNNRTFLYEFGPSGTTFSKPVTITIPYNATTLVSSPSAYWYNPLTGLYSQEGITDVEVIQISSGLYALRFKTTHFSIFGGGGPFGGLFGGGGGGGGGCSMSPNSQDSIAELLLPYIGLAVAMVVLKLRDRRKRKAHNITKSEC